MGFSRQEHWSGLPFPSSRGSSPPRDQTQVPCIEAGSLSHWTTREVPPMQGGFFFFFFLRGPQFNLQHSYSINIGGLLSAQAHLLDPLEFLLSFFPFLEMKMDTQRRKLLFFSGCNNFVDSLDKRSVFKRERKKKSSNARVKNRKQQG